MLHHVVLATRFSKPIERKRQSDDTKCNEAEAKSAVEFFGLEFFVVHVGLAVRGQFNFRTNLGAPLTDVHSNCDDKRDEKKDGNDVTNRLLSNRQQIKILHQ